MEEHEVWDSVGFGKLFEMQCNCCLVVLEHITRMSALASGSREEKRFYYSMEAVAPCEFLGDFPRREQSRKRIGDRLRTGCLNRYVGKQEKDEQEDWD